jgi:hypothetical protein
VGRAVACLSFPADGQALVPDANCAGPVDNVAANGNHTEVVIAEAMILDSPVAGTKVSVTLG